MQMRLQDLEYHAPARMAIRISRARAIARALQQRIEVSPRTRALLEASPYWLAAIAGVLAYLLLAAWMQNAELRAQLRARELEQARLTERASDLEVAIAEAAATRGEPLYYVLEAHTPTEARDKLQRLGLLISKRHYELSEQLPQLVMP
jgi:hypothetical protein